MEKTLTGIDSLVSFKNSKGRNGRGTLIHITRTSIVFEVYNPYSIVQFSEVLPHLEVIRGERVIYKGRVVVSHLLSTGLMTIVSATLVDAWSDLNGLMPGKELRTETERFIQDWVSGHQILPGYQLIVGTLRNFLAELNRWLEEAEVGNFGIEEPGELEQLMEDFYKDTHGPVMPKFVDLFEEFETEAAKVDSEEIMVHKSFARRELHPLILCAPYVDRSYNKPLGYAGDYELINMTMRTSTAGKVSVYAKLIHNFCVETVATVGHRNRITMLQDRLHDEAVRVVEEEERLFSVLNIGCGPSLEVQRFVRDDELSNQTSFQLMDFEPLAIDYSKEKVSDAIREGGNRPMVKYTLKSIDDLLKEVHEQGNLYPAAFDFIYCAGLFDYFSDQVCKRLVEQYYRWLRPGGLLSVTNVHSRNPNRQLMEHLLEWHLVYRDDNHMESLAPDSTKFDVVTDVTGVSVFLDIRKPKND